MKKYEKESTRFRLTSALGCERVTDMMTADRKTDRKKIEAMRQRGDNLSATLAAYNPSMAHFSKLGAAYSMKPVKEDG